MQKQNIAVDASEETDVRQSWAHLPLVLQSFLTWLSGKPLPGQLPLIQRTPISHFFTAYLTLFVGVAIAVTSYCSGQLIFLPIGWLLIVSGARKLATTINHYAVHGDALPPSMRRKYKKLQMYIGEFNSSMLFLLPFRDYVKEHLFHHGQNIVASIIDPDMAFLWKLGFKAGMTKSKLWAVYYFNLLVPFSKLHRLFVIARLRSAFQYRNLFRSVIQLLTIFTLICIGMLTSFGTIFWAVIFPMTYLYHISSLMQFSSEHRWLDSVQEDGLLKTKNNHEVLKERKNRITSARFMGTHFPEMTKNPLVNGFTTLVWVLKMLFIHLPLRLFVLPGDLVVHDWHHRCGYGADWSNAFYTRQLSVNALKPGDAPYTEIWGFGNAVDSIFDGLSKMAPIHPDEAEIDDDAVLGM